jgi:hypothetical protein
MVLIEAGTALADKLQKINKEKNEGKKAVNYVEKMLIPVLEDNYNNLEVAKHNIHKAITKESTELKQRRKDYKRIKNIKTIKHKINILYKSNREKFDLLKQSVEMLINILTAAHHLVRNKTKTVEEIKAEIKKHKNNIVDILGVEIKLQGPIEDFLSKDN